MLPSRRALLGLLVALTIGAPVPAIGLPSGFVTNWVGPGCASGCHLPSVAAAISPDGRMLYTTDWSRVITWQLLDGDGFPAGTAGLPCDPDCSLQAPFPGNVEALHVAADGASLYVIGGGTILRLARDPVTGGVSGSDACTLGGSDCTSVGQGNASVVFAPDDRDVYVSDPLDGRIAAFHRTADGTLQAAGCLGNSRTPFADGCLSAGKGFGAVIAMAVSADAVYILSHASAYLGGDIPGRGFLIAFHRDQSTGGLTRISGSTGCATAGGVEGCLDLSLESTSELALVPGALALGDHSHLRLDALALEPSTGALLAIAGPAGCAASADAGCRQIPPFGFDLLPDASGAAVDYAVGDYGTWRVLGLTEAGFDTTTREVVCPRGCEPITSPRHVRVPGGAVAWQLDVLVSTVHPRCDAGGSRDHVTPLDLNTLCGDGSGAPVAIVADGAPLHGAIDGASTYHPDPAYLGLLDLPVVVTGPAGPSHLTITMEFTDWFTPSFVANGAVTLAGLPLPIDGRWWSDDDPLSFAIVTPPSHGSLSALPDGTFVYVPDSGFVGTDAVEVSASDGALVTTRTFNLTIRAAPVPLVVIPHTLPMPSWHGMKVVFAYARQRYDVSATEPADVVRIDAHRLDESDAAYARFDAGTQFAGSTVLRAHEDRATGLQLFQPDVDGPPLVVAVGLKIPMSGKALPGGLVLARVSAPSVPGTLTLERRLGSRWITVQKLKPDARGGVQVRMRAGTGVFRIAFRPTDAVRYVPTARAFRPRVVQNRWLQTSGLPSGPIGGILVP